MSPRQRISIVIPLVGLMTYWVVCFAATHVPVTHGIPGRIPSVPHLDKIAHAVMYGGLAFLLCWAFQRLFQGSRTARPLALCVALLYGGLDEFLQQFVPTRTMDFYDWVADVVGAIGGAILFQGSWLTWSAWNRRGQKRERQVEARRDRIEPPRIVLRGESGLSSIESWQTRDSVRLTESKLPPSEGRCADESSHRTACL